jgi:hypothetical protein
MYEPVGKVFHSVQKRRFFLKTGMLVDRFHELQQFVCHAGRLALIMLYSQQLDVRFVQHSRTV